VTDLRSPGPDESGGPTLAEGALGLAPHRDGDTAVLRLTGELDLNGVAEVEAALVALEADLPGVLLVDLSGLAFVDSSGVRVVLLAQARAAEAGRRLVVDLGRGPARRLFDVLGLLPRMDLVDP
jgi:anti-anti-sigma factor